MNLRIFNKKGFVLLDKDRHSSRNYLTGFTLLEVLISALIMSLVMTGLVNIFLAGKRHILHSRSRMQTAELGRLFLAPLQMDIRQDQWSAGSNCLTSTGTTGCPGVQTVDNIPYTPTYENSALLVDAQNPLGRLRKVKVTINWTEPSF